MTTSKLRSVVCTLATVLVASALPSMAAAQQPRTVVLGFSGGVSLPNGDFADKSTSGYNINLHLFVNSHDKKKNLGFRGDLLYDHWKGKPILPGTIRALGGFGNAIYSLGARDLSFRPYVVAGAGFDNIKRSVPNLCNGTCEISDTKPAVQGGVGLQFFLRNFSSFLEARYVNVFATGGSTSWLPITFGFHF